MTRKPEDPSEPTADATAESQRPDPQGQRRRPPNLSPGWRTVWLVVGGVDLASSIPSLLRGAWLWGAAFAGMGFAILTLAIAPGLLPAFPRRPVSEKQRRRATWMRAHTVPSTIVVGLPWALGCAALSERSDAYWPGWPISLAFWIPGGVVYGLIMVRWMSRRIPPAMETDVDAPLSPQ